MTLDPCTNLRVILVPAGRVIVLSRDLQRRPSRGDGGYAVSVAIRNMFSLSFFGAAWIGYLKLPVDGRHAPALLKDMNQFVSDKTLSFAGLRRIPALSEHNVLPECVGDCIECFGGLSGFMIRVDSHPAEIMFEASLHVSSCGSIQSGACTAHDVIDLICQLI
jgi:hypothetical protein